MEPSEQTHSGRGAEPAMEPRGLVRSPCLEKVPGRHGVLPGAALHSFLSPLASVRNNGAAAWNAWLFHKAP